MNLGEVGPGCPRCGRGVHDGACLPPPFPPNRRLREGELPPLPRWQKAVLWAVVAALAASGLYGLYRLDRAERRAWKAEWMRRTELCEAQGGIPRYQVRGRSYDGCDFPKENR